MAHGCFPLTIAPAAAPLFLMNTYKNFPVFYADSAESWRSYLAAHHDRLDNTWLILYKKGTDTSQPYLRGGPRRSTVLRLDRLQTQ